MSGKILSIVALCVAVIAAAIAGVVVTNNRADVARANQAKAEQLAEKAKAEARAAKAAENAARANKEAKEAEQRKAEQDRVKAEADRVRAAEEAKAAEENRKAAEANRDAAAEKADAAELTRQAEKARAESVKAACNSSNEVARAAAEKAAAEARAAEAKLATEKAKADAVVAEAKALELRKIDFETAERQLLEFQQELDERERALHPDKTAADLEWVAEREPDVIGGETNRFHRAKKVSPEDDRTLPPVTRLLAKEERIRGEELAAAAISVRKRVTAKLEQLYVQALREDRPVDAEYYLKNIRLFYPDWRYEPKGK